MEIYFARCGRKRAYVVAPSKERAQELAGRHLGIPSRTVSVTPIDHDVVVDIEHVKALP